jgi:putative transposase
MSKIVDGRRSGRLCPVLSLHVILAALASWTENPSWGYTRMQGALKNLGHRVARSTVVNILKEEGIPPSGQRPMSWRTFLRAHWGAMPSANANHHCRAA